VEGKGEEERVMGHMLDTQKSRGQKSERLLDIIERDQEYMKRFQKLRRRTIGRKDNGRGG